MLMGDRTSWADDAVGGKPDRIKFITPEQRPAGESGSASLIKPGLESRETFVNQC
jgi:hypothetical protein